MTRSRASNRFNRFTAKKRRQSLRSSVPELTEDTPKGQTPNNLSHKLREEACVKEGLMDLLEPQSNS